MSEHQLPPNIDGWPNNPYELLGLAYGADRRELKRAYMRLIRKFKPDFYPEHFRRIRAAYDQLLPYTAAHRQDADTSDEVIPASVQHTLRPVGTKSPRPSSVIQQTQTSQADVETETTSLWKQAAADGAVEAYASLVKLCRRQPLQRESYLRLYWLLKIRPELDPARDACGWLVEGMRQLQPRGELLQLYCMELRVRPEEAVGDRATRLLQQSLSTSSLHQLARSRWECCRKLNRGDLIGDDLAHLRPRVASENHEFWLRLMLLAVEQLAWSEDKPSEEQLSKCRAEIEELAEWELKFHEELGRCDFLWELACERRKLLKQRSPICKGIASLVPLTWNGQVAEYRTKLLTLVGKLLQQPAHSLKVLDQLGTMAPTTAHHLHGLLERFDVRRQTNMQPPSAAADELEILRFFDGIGIKPYRRIRVAVLKFCTDEAFEPREIVQALCKFSNYRTDGSDDGDLAQSICDDVSLNLLAKAHRVFWS